MSLTYNKIIESSTEPATNNLWLKDGKLYYYKGGWLNISGTPGSSEDIKIPTKVSELINDESFATTNDVNTAITEAITNTLNTEV